MLHAGMVTSITLKGLASKCTPNIHKRFCLLIILCLLLVFTYTVLSVNMLFCVKSVNKYGKTVFLFSLSLYTWKRKYESVERIN